jgi:hypothetical protein
MQLSKTFALPDTLFVSTASVSFGTLTSELPSLAVISLSYASMIGYFVFEGTLPEGLCRLHLRGFSRGVPCLGPRFFRNCSVLAA